MAVDFIRFRSYLLAIHAGLFLIDQLFSLTIFSQTTGNERHIYMYIICLSLLHFINALYVGYRLLTYLKHREYRKPPPLPSRSDLELEQIRQFNRPSETMDNSHDSFDSDSSDSVYEKYEIPKTSLILA